MKPEGLKILDRLHGTLLKNEFPVEIIGHTDNRPPQTGGSNRELSSIRSLKILQHVLNRGSIKLDRITAFGWGQFRPVVSNETREKPVSITGGWIFCLYTIPWLKIREGYLHFGSSFSMYSNRR